jgi:hypothetical protein
MSSFPAQWNPPTCSVLWDQLLTFQLDENSNHIQFASFFTNEELNNAHVLEEYPSVSEVSFKKYESEGGLVYHYTVERTEEGRGDVELKNTEFDFKFSVESFLSIKSHFDALVIVESESGSESDSESD